jgi:DNA-binding transcriptional LysR family regulator
MDIKDLRGMDLNLLVVLDALLDEAHVTRAAERVHLSQPATSAALERCRHLFGDPLLERGGQAGLRGMRLSAKAEALRGPLKAALASVQALMSPAAPDLLKLRASVRLMMSDYPAVQVALQLLPALHERAPGIGLVFMPWRGGADAVEALRRGTADLAVSVLPAQDVDLAGTRLSFETYAVAMRRGHPAAQGFGLDAWLAQPHRLVSGRGESRSPLDETLAQIGRQRRVGLVVPSFSMVAPLLQATDLIAMLPRRCIAADDEALAVFEPPVAVDGFSLHMAWHRRSAADPAVQHVAQRVREVLG